LCTHFSSSLFALYVSYLLDNATVWVEGKHAESDYEMLIKTYKPKYSISRFKKQQSTYVEN
jgi:hypothetical protein